MYVTVCVYVCLLFCFVSILNTRNRHELALLQLTVYQRLLSLLPKRLIVVYYLDVFKIPQIGIPV